MQIILIFTVILIVVNLGSISAAGRQTDPVLTNYQRKNASTLDKLRRSLSTHWINHKSCALKDFGYNQSETSSQTRTRFVWKLPSKNDMYDFMYAMSGPKQMFNHDCVGFTKPTDSSSQLMSTTVTTNASLSSSPVASLTMEEWWPNSEEREGWTLKRYTRRVGKGTKCYNSVKDKILDWEFAHQEKVVQKDQPQNTMMGIQEPSCGILRAIPKASHQPQNFIPENINQNVFQICNDPMMNICRKLVTFTKFDLRIPFVPNKVLFPIPFLPRAMYAVNPVAVVYDIIDERVPNDGSGKSLYTSSAYSTLKGHLLSGEERVTVIMRGDHDTVDIGSILPATAGRINGNFMHNDASLSSSSDGGGWVDVEIVSYSKAAPSLLGRMVWPFVGKKQDSFFTSEMDALEYVARQETFP